MTAKIHMTELPVLVSLNLKNKSLIPEMPRLTLSDPAISSVMTLPAAMLTLQRPEF